MQTQNKSNNVLFGPAGNSESFAHMGYKSSTQVPEYLETFGLTAFEYQCGRGVRISEEMARQIGEKMAEKQITVSLHAPYYISLSGADESKRVDGSIDHILKSARAVDWMGGNRIIVHTGSVGKLTRVEAVSLARDTLEKALEALEKNGFGHIHICLETMGKTGQLGNLEEVLELCKLDDSMIPCVDFGHLYARGFGEQLMNKKDFKSLFDTMELVLGKKRMKNFHAHFSKIEFSKPGGEKRHLTFANEQFGPPFEPFIELIHERDYNPVVICESAGTQAEDAKTMKLYYESL